MPTLFPKLLVLVLCAGVTAGALLVIRHRQFQTVNEMSRVHRRLATQNRALWDLRCRAAERCRPEDVRRLLDDATGEWTPVVPPALDDVPPEPPPRPFRDRGPATASLTAVEQLGG